MRNQDYKKTERGGIAQSLFSERTEAKSSGLAFSLSAVLPLFLSIFFLLTVSVVGVGENYQTEDWYLYASFLLPQLSFAIVAFCYLKYTKTPVIRAVKSQKCEWKYFLVAFFMQIGLLCLSELNGLFLKFLENFGYTDSEIHLPSTDGFGFVGVFFVVALLPAVFEEIIFQGALLKGLRSFGRAGATVLCGGLFALYHQNPAQTLYQFCCGVAFATVALRAGSILPTVLSHFLNNAVVLILYETGITEYSTPVLIVVLAVSVLSLVGTLVYLFAFDKKKEGESVRLTEQERKEERKRFWIFSATGIAVCAFTWLSVLISGM